MKTKIFSFLFIVVSVLACENDDDNPISIIDEELLGSYEVISRTSFYENTSVSLGGETQTITITSEASEINTVWTFEAGNLHTYTGSFLLNFTRDVVGTSTMENTSWTQNEDFDFSNPYSFDNSKNLIVIGEDTDDNMATQYKIVQADGTNLILEASATEVQPPNGSAQTVITLRKL